MVFKPNFIGLEQDDIHKLTFSIMKCDVDIIILYVQVVQQCLKVSFKVQKEIKASPQVSVVLCLILFYFIFFFFKSSRQSN